MSDWRDTWAILWYVVDESPDDRYRVNARIEHGQVLRYTVQYEAKFGSRFHPVSRNDTAHGVPHRDTLDWNGHVIRKDPFPGTPLNLAPTEAINDVRANWENYREEFERSIR